MIAAADINEIFHPIKRLMFTLTSAQLDHYHSIKHDSPLFLVGEVDASKERVDIVIIDTLEAAKEASTSNITAELIGVDATKVDLVQLKQHALDHGIVVFNHEPSQSKPQPTLYSRR